ncbi:MAG: hypothetical protein NVS3B28_16960 [Candidatus Velthaea sp.]
MIRPQADGDVDSGLRIDGLEQGGARVERFVAPLDHDTAGTDRIDRHEGASGLQTTVQCIRPFTRTGAGARG